MDHGFDPYHRKYQSLSVPDLLEAREAYHTHLLHLENVFATAIGRFRIRRSDPDSNAHIVQSATHHHRSDEPRTFQNTVVRDWSWPCVLVFVKQWYEQSQLRRHLDDLVPPFLYLPDGRVIPTCVLQADLYMGEAEAVIGIEQQAPVFASGQPIITRVQGEEHIGTVAGMVSDGEKYYALTNQHVAGEKGTEVFAYVEGDLIRIGVSAGLEQKRRAFQEVYPGLAGTHTLSNLDVGLVELDSLTHWTSNMHSTRDRHGRSTRQLGAIMEFRSDTASLDWVGCHVVGFGAASGEIEGEIKALFYRYRSIGGTDYVSDFLISDRDPDEEGKPGKNKKPDLSGDGDQSCHGTRPGDSGSLWCVDPEQLKNPKDALPRPFAVQWGGQKLTTAGGPAFTRYALGSSLAVGCRELDVEIVTDWNIDHTQYWGAVGHYKIAEMAISLLTGDLQTFMSQHLKLLTYQNILEEPAKLDPETQFIPLADVPDLVWKKPRAAAAGSGGTDKAGTVKRYDFGRRGPENPNHYADIDLLDKAGKKQISTCGTDASAWQKFYNVCTVPPAGLKEAEAQAKKNDKPAPSKTSIEYQHQGLLPFRIWQIFEQLKGYAAAGSAAEFLCAAGIIAHYVGDACQPLHGSRHADGLEGAATGVHSSYEELMVNFAAKDIAKGLSSFDFDDLQAIASGKAAAAATLKVMKAAAGILPPEDICNVFDKFKKDNGITSKSPSKKSAPLLAEKFTDKTVQCMELGIQLLASLWQSAFTGAPKSSFHTTIVDSQLMTIYKKQDFLPSYYLSSWIEKVGKGT